MNGECNNGVMCMVEGEWLVMGSEWVLYVVVTPLVEAGGECMVVCCDSPGGSWGRVYGCML